MFSNTFELEVLLVTLALGLIWEVNQGLSEF